MKERDELLEDRERTMMDHYKASEYLRKELQVKTEEVKALERAAEARDASFVAEKASLAAEASAREDASVREAREKEAFALERVAALERELAEVQAFRERFAAVRAEADEAKRDLDAALAKAAAREAALEERHLEEKATLRAAHDARLEAMTRDQADALDRRYGANVRRVLAQNRDMAEDLRMHVVAAEALRVDNTRAAEASDKWRRDATLAKSEAREAAKVGSKHRRALAEKTARVEQLSASVATLASAFTTERVRLECETAEATRRAEDARASASRDEQRWRREVLRAERKATEAASRRAEAERFVVESLDVVKREVAIRRREAEAEAAKETTRAPFVRGFANANAPPPERVPVDLKALRATLDANRGAATAVSEGRPEFSDVDAFAAGGVDVGDLTWEERERVLRLLFARLRAEGRGASRKGNAAAGERARPASSASDATESLVGRPSDGIRPGIA